MYRIGLLFTLETLVLEQFLLQSRTSLLCFAPLLKVKRPVSYRFLKRSGPCLNTFIWAEIATEAQSVPGLVFPV